MTALYHQNVADLPRIFLGVRDDKATITLALQLATVPTLCPA
jgi:hypothetical protein